LPLAKTETVQMKMTLIMTTQTYNLLLGKFVLWNKNLICHEQDLILILTKKNVT
jgi:hypothetical protein